jgi:hypothetical protein
LISGAAGDGWDDGDIIPLFERGFQVLQKTDIVTVYVNVYESADLAGFVAKAFFDTREMLLEILNDRLYIRSLRANLIGTMSKFSEWSGNTNSHWHSVTSLNFRQSR